MRIIDCQLLILKYNPIGSGYVPLPKFIADKKACVNVHNFDNRCFGYAVLSAILDPLNGNHKSEARYYTETDFQVHGLDQIQYPVPVEMVPQLEEQLQTSFNLFSFYDGEGRGRYVMYVSRRTMPREIDLLYFDNHYVWIKNFSRLFQI